jgi:preprotein translocase subunit SecG
MLYYAVATFFVLTCFVLMLVVLIQQGKGGDLASAFGGGGSSQAAFGARTGATLLTKVTWVCAALFVIGALALSVIRQRGPSSVLGSVAAPKPAATAPATSGTPGPAAPAPATPAAPKQ